MNTAALAEATAAADSELLASREHVFDSALAAAGAAPGVDFSRLRLRHRCPSCPSRTPGGPVEKTSSSEHRQREG